MIERNDRYAKRGRERGTEREKERETEPERKGGRGVISCRPSPAHGEV